jgi:isopentenyl-diphosphate delta-isomerase
MNDQLILVDENDKAWGKLEKQMVHELGILHRAFSVFIFNTQGEMLLQRRADNKYHSGGLWTNACCSHPRYGESLESAVARRLMEEMGLRCYAAHAFSFVYRASLGNGLTEHELDHVFIGTCDSLPRPDPAEVQDWKYVGPAGLIGDLEKNPGRYTVWFGLAVRRVLEHRNLLQVA